MIEAVPSQTPVSAAGPEVEVAGITHPSDPGRRGAFLADVIVELGFAGQETIDEATQAARQSERTLERYLLENGILDEHQLSLAIAERNGLDHVDLDSFEVDMGAVEMVGRSAAQRYRAMPIAFAPDGALIVAVEDPFTLGINDIEVMTRSEVRPVIATASGIQGLIEGLPKEVPSRPPLEPLPTPEAAPTRLEPVPTPEAEQPAPPAPQSSPAPAPNGDLGDLTLELQALQETARRADALAVTVGRRIEELEAADERAQRLEQELAAAQERIAELERRLSGVDTVADELRATTEKLESLNRILQDSAG